MAHCTQASLAPPTPGPTEPKGERAVPSRLSIHAQTVAGSRHPARPFAQLRTFISELLNNRQTRSLSLKIENLKGLEWFSKDDAGTDVELLLPPDTYQVTANFAGIRRCYILTLEDGRPFELQIRFAADSH